MAKIDLLSAAKVKNLKLPGDYFDGRGLYLQVRSESSKSWLLKYSLDKGDNRRDSGRVRGREMGLGSFPDITLEKARDLRGKFRELLAQGFDPIEHRKAEQAGRAAADAKAITFKQAAERYITANLSSWKNQKHADQWRMTMLGIDRRGKPAKNDYCKPIRDLPIQSTDTTLVMKILDPIWSTKSETAGRIRQRIETVINSAKARGEYVGENPARWDGHLEHQLPKRSKIRGTRKKNHPALPYAELSAFMMDLQSREGIAAAALEFHILTAARPGNAVRTRWSEIDRKEAAWNIRGDDMKAEKDHRVPLSAGALAVLDRMEKVRAGEFVFYSPKSKRALSDAAMGAVIDRMCKVRKWIDPKSGRKIVPHGFRATFRTWGGEETNFAREILEKALAHQVGDESERSYDRGDLFDRRRALMEAWGSFATSDPAKVGDNVVAIKGAAAR